MIDRVQKCLHGILGVRTVHIGSRGAAVDADSDTGRIRRLQVTFQALPKRNNIESVIVQQAIILVIEFRSDIPVAGPVIETMTQGPHQVLVGFRIETGA